MPQRIYICWPALPGSASSPTCWPNCAAPRTRRTLSAFSNGSNCATDERAYPPTDTDAQESKCDSDALVETAAPLQISRLRPGLAVGFHLSLRLANAC